MNLTELIDRAVDIISKARVANLYGVRAEAYGHLVELRELLNDRPELEAGGAHNPDKSTQGKNYVNIWRKS